MLFPIRVWVGIIAGSGTAARSMENDTENSLPGESQSCACRSGSPFGQEPGRDSRTKWFLTRNEEESQQLSAIVE